jgi:hypothetical protein
VSRGWSNQLADKSSFLLESEVSEALAQIQQSLNGDTVASRTCGAGRQLR